MAPTTNEVAAQLFELVDSESGPAGRKGVRWRLRLFLQRFGNLPIDRVGAPELVRFKTLIAKHSPEYRNNQIAAVRRLLRLATDCGYAGSFPFGILKSVKLGPAKRKDIPVAALKELFRAAAGINRPLACMMLANFYQTARPSEMPKIMYGIGERQSDGFTLSIVSKTTAKTGELRPVVLLPETEILIAEFQMTRGKRRLYSTANAYRLACNVVGQAIGETALATLMGRTGPLTARGIGSANTFIALLTKRLS